MSQYGEQAMINKHNYFLPVYMNLEKEVVSLSRQILFNDEQLDVYSLSIADLIVRCAIEIEALSKELYWENGGGKVYDKEGKERDLFFDTDCINHLDHIWNICEKEIIVSCDSFYFEKEENIIIRPLHKANKRSGAVWNKAYQAVKHDRRRRIKDGNIRNLILILGSLYILNLYYLDKRIDLGTSKDPMSLFDPRMGSSIFSAAAIDATINVTMGADSDEDIYSEDIREGLKNAIYIVRYKQESWHRINEALREDKVFLIESMKESGELQAYIKEHPEEFGDGKQQHILSLAYKVMGKGFAKLNTFNREFNNGHKEAILNKNKPIY